MRDAIAGTNEDDKSKKRVGGSLAPAFFIDDNNTADLRYVL